MGARILIVENEILVAADMEALVEDLGYVSAGIARDMTRARALAAGQPDVASSISTSATDRPVPRSVNGWASAESW